jgi:uncharacterized membrane protein YwzB
VDVNIIQLIVIVIIAGLCWWANESLNNVPVLKKVVQVLIVVVAVLLVLQSLGVMGDNHLHISAH